MDEDERYREVEKRERLVQTFLIIGGFLVAYTSAEFQRFVALIFSIYFIFAILYYIFISRTRMYLITDFFALFSSYFYSLIILAFFSLQSTKGLSDWNFYSLFILLTGIFTFALLSPESSEKIVNWVEKISNEVEEKHPTILKITLAIIAILVLVWGIYLYSMRHT